MKTQEEYLQEVLDIKKANPDASIHLCVNSDDLSDEGCWTGHLIDNVTLGFWVSDGEHIYTDEDEIKEHFEERYYDLDISDEELESKVDEDFKREAKQAILIYTHAG